jgi:hypothetical protein
MFNYTLINNEVISQNPKVIFDTNAYRNFVKLYLNTTGDFTKIVDNLRDCERNCSVVPSDNILTLMELYKHLIDRDNAYQECEKAIIFSFERGLINNSLYHQPLPEIEIATRIFNKVLDSDNNINCYFLEGHLKFCMKYYDIEFSKKEFIKNVGEQILLYKKNSFSSIINNIQRLSPDFDTATSKFTKKGLKNFKKYGNKRNELFEQLATTLYEAFKFRLKINEDSENKDGLIEQIKSDYKPALLSYIKIIEKFSKNSPTNNAPFKLNENDLIDSFILFSIVPDENIILVTDERKIHNIFKEINRADFIYTLEGYLKKIGFKGDTN